MSLSIQQILDSAHGAPPITTGTRALLMALLALGGDGTNAGVGGTTDAAVAAGAPGSVSAKLRTLTAQLAALIAANHADLIALRPTLTPHFALLGASSNQVIPAGAKGWTAVIITGTGTIGGVAVPAGLGDSDAGVLATTVTVTTDAASTAYVRWNT